MTARCCNCGKIRSRKRNGRIDGALDFCRACYGRFDRAGRPDGGPPPPMTAAQRTARSAATQREQRDDRIAEYEMFLRLGNTPLVAGRRIGVSDNTRREYDRILRDRKAHASAA